MVELTLTDFRDAGAFVAIVVGFVLMAIVAVEVWRGRQ